MKFVSRIFLVPAAVYASVMIGGGYGTGREIVQYFSSLGLVDGLIALATAVCCFALVMFLTFEFARVKRSYDYRVFFKDLIGPFWWLFEALYLILMLLVISVIGSASAEILQQRLNIPVSVGTALIFGLMLLTVELGRRYLELLMGLWLSMMYLLFAVYFCFVIYAVPTFGGPDAELSGSIGKPLASGMLYAFYNLSVVPVLLYAVRDLASRTEAAMSGVFTALVVVMPALLFHLSFVSAPAVVLEEPVPMYWMIEAYTPSMFLQLFVVVLLGTLTQTGAGLLQGFLERVEGALPMATESKSSTARARSSLSRLHRALLVMLILALSAVLSSFGIIALIGKGYALLAVGFGLVYVLPLLAQSLVQFIRPLN